MKKSNIIRLLDVSLLNDVQIEPNLGSDFVLTNEIKEVLRGIAFGYYNGVRFSNDEMKQLTFVKYEDRVIFIIRTKMYSLVTRLHAVEGGFHATITSIGGPQ